MKHRVDIISSALNEEDAIVELYERIERVFSQEHGYIWKLTLFDNGSSDGTWAKILQLSEQYSNIEGYRMSRTFPLDAAFTAGMQQAEGDVAIIMASDLQDPPEVIPLLLRKWEKGALHVVVRVLKRSDISFFRKVLTKIFYRLSFWASEGLIPENVSDFRLMDKRVYSAVNQIHERNRFMRGLIAWTGFPTQFVDIERPPRHSGFSKVKYLPIIRFSIKAIFANSSKPISFISSAGFVLSLFSLSTILFFSLQWLISGVPFAGYGTIVGLLFLFFSLTIGVLGIIAEYVSLIYIEVKARPHSILWESTTKLNQNPQSLAADEND
jgi:glycosyltransferase involved in cell wall biosynthesis